MDIKPIRTEADYQAALREVESLMTADFGTPEGDRLDVLATLVEAYEAKHFPMEVADPVEAIKFQMDQKGLTVEDLEPMIGRSNRGARGAESNSSFDTSDDLAAAQRTWYSCRGSYPSAQRRRCCLTHWRQLDLVVSGPNSSGFTRSEAVHSSIT
jgi:antitoxin component HigA of HigAB toxin-antitoxin module